MGDHVRVVKYDEWRAKTQRIAALEARQADLERQVARAQREVALLRATMMTIKNETFTNQPAERQLERIAGQSAEALAATSEPAPSREPCECEDDPCTCSGWNGVGR